MREWCTRLLRQDEGQDVVEYALLASLVALASVAAIGQLETALHDALVRWDTANDALWLMPPPTEGP